MPLWLPRESARNDPAWWAPLERLAAVTQRAPRVPSLVVCEFMFMGRDDRGRRPRIWLYKHAWTRACLHLDDAGHAYMWAGASRYVPWRGLADALAAAGLDDVPASWRQARAMCDACRVGVRDVSLE